MAQHNEKKLSLPNDNGKAMYKLILICAFLAFTMPALAWEEKAVELDNGTWKYQRLKIKDLDTGKTKKIKYRIYGVNRDRIRGLNTLIESGGFSQFLVALATIFSRNKGDTPLPLGVGAGLKRG